MANCYTPGCEQSCNHDCAKNRLNTLNTPGNEKLKDQVLELRDVVWGQDIPHPTIPEYVEHHQSIVKILKFIDTKLIKEDIHE